MTSVLPASQHENSLRRSVSQLAVQMAQALGKEWADRVGIEANRAKPWCGQGCASSLKRQIPHPRELFVLCYVAGVTPEITALVMEGRWHSGPIPTDMGSIESRLDFISHSVAMKVKGYREADLKLLVDEYTAKLGKADRARKVLTMKLGIPDLSDAVKGVVALPDYADAIVARMLGRDISDHWGLHMVVVDAEFISDVNAAHRAIGEREDDLIESAVGAMGVMQIGNPDEDGGDFVYCPFRGVALRELVRPHHLSQSFVLEGANGAKVLFHFRECRISGLDASEAGVENTIYYRAKVQVANKDLEPQVRPCTIEKQVDADTIEGLLSQIASIALLADGLNTVVLGVKIPTPEAETVALAVGIPVSRGRAVASAVAATAVAATTSVIMQAVPLFSFA